MADMFGPTDPSMTNSLSAIPDDIMGLLGGMPPEQSPYDEARLLNLFEKLKREAFANRWVWEREWLRDIYYTTGRQWIYFHPTRREWVDKRLAKNVPRPVTNKVAEIVQSLRASFGAIELGVIARPVGHNPQSVATAEIVDKIAPLIHEEHRMPMVMREADFWLIVTGNVVLQTSWDTDKRFNRTFIRSEQCMGCGMVYPPKAFVDAGNACPDCGSQGSTPASNPDGTPAGEYLSFGKGKTTALSPFEFAIPSNVTRFDDAPYIIRLRWRDRSYYESNYPELVHKIVWEKSPQDRSLQIYKSLTMVNDIGSGGSFGSLSAGGADSGEGVTEYELWLRPTDEFKEGLVMRVVGDKNPLLLQKQDEGLPGPLPFKDKEGAALWPFAFACFEQIGGRLYGRSALAPIIQKQDQLNQLDSLIQQIVQRVANPVWVVPEGAGIDHFTGDPGLVLKWNPLAAGGQGKPERIAGENVPSTLFRLREQYLKDIEELAGTYDIIKGQKPSGVEAFSALQLLVERSQARFTSAFASRGEMYRSWFSVALELERQFGPQERVMTAVSPNKGYTFNTFQNAQLQGNVTIKVEDGTQAPKTPLGQRAAIEHANVLGLLDPQDPDQKYSILTYLGLSNLVPSLDVHIQTALQIQDAFERWVENPVGMPPLVVKPWHDPQIHFGERIKWLNSDHMRELLAARPEIEPVIALHLQELQMLMMPPVPVGPDGQPIEDPNAPPVGGSGAGRAMSNSNNNSSSPASNPGTRPQPSPSAF